MIIIIIIIKLIELTCYMMCSSGSDRDDSVVTIRGSNFGPTPSTSLVQSKLGSGWTVNLLTRKKSARFWPTHQKFRFKIQFGLNNPDLSVGALLYFSPKKIRAILSCPDVGLAQLSPSAQITIYCCVVGPILARPTHQFFFLKGNLARSVRI